mmetsp:Transcript_102918/g.291480  ORF Transcript_102918/g.291480 Transcript_102918/m.291480 type:complete len:87 (+) Transcript_102918:108-368(+)
MRMLEIEKAEKLAILSRRAYRESQSAAADARARVRSEGAPTASQKAFGTCHVAPHRRQLKHQMVQGDGRGRMLSRVFVNGQWVYAP